MYFFVKSSVSWILYFHYTDLTSNPYLGIYNGFSKNLLGFWRYPWALCHAANFFFSIRVFVTDTDDSQDSKEREGINYSTLPLPPANEHWDIYLQLCMWDDYHVLLIATLVFTRLLLDEIYHLIELPFKWLIDDAMFVCLLGELILGFCYSDLTLETSGFELASTITLVLQANRLTKCASHPIISTGIKTNRNYKRSC